MTHSITESLEWFCLIHTIAKQHPEDYVFFYLPKEHVSYVDTGEAITVWSWRKEEDE